MYAKNTAMLYSHCIVYYQTQADTLQESMLFILGLQREITYLYIFLNEEWSGKYVGNADHRFSVGCQTYAPILNIIVKYYLKFTINYIRICN